MARNPTGCDFKRTCLNTLLTLAVMVAIGIADHFASIPPRANISPSGTLIFSTQKKITLKCEAEDTPDPRIEWYADDTVLQPKSCSGDPDYCMGEDSRELILIKDYPSEVWCIVKNNFGTAKSDKVLLIYHALKPYRRRNTMISVLEHDSYLIKVNKAFQNGPLGQTSWKPSDERFIVTSKGHLFISDVLASDDKRVLQCIYTSNAGQYVSCGHKTLNVTKLHNKDPENTINCNHCGSRPEPVTVIEGHSIKLDCLVSGSPKPTIKWTHNGKEVGQGHQYKLTAAVNRSGHYQCTAHNLKGQETKAYILKIETKPKVTERPQDTVMDVNQVEKDQVEFKCSGTGDPLPEAQWYINTTRIPEFIRFDHYVATTEEKTSTLKISNIKSQVFATVHCNLSNSHDYEWFQARLSITGTKRIPPTSTIKPAIIVKTTPTTTASTTTTTTTTPTTTTTTTTPTTTTTTTTRKSASPQKASILSTTAGTFINDPNGNDAIKEETNDSPKIVLEYETILVIIVVAILVIILVLVVICVVLCYQRKNRRDEEPRYPRSVSNLSYISHLQRIRDFDDRASDRASDDSGIDERSHMKSKISIPLSENQDNQRNEYDELSHLDDVV